KLTLTAYLTIDGIMQGAGASTEDGADGFDLGGWLVPFADTDMGAYVTEWFANADAFLLGRKTYEIMHSHWPRVTDATDVVATKLNGLPKYVVSRTLHSPSWANTYIIDNDLVAAIEALKSASGRELQLHGSRELAHA